MKVLGSVRRNGKLIRYVGDVCNLALDHVIPRESNNHRPHLTKSWFLGLVAISLIVTKAFVVLAPVFLPQHSVYSSAITASNILTLTNAERKALDLPSLKTSTQLSLAAQKKAMDMAELGYFAHKSPNGSTMRTFITSTGYAYSSAGENLAMKFTQAEDVATAWMLSPTHRANILKSSYTETGVGIAESTRNGVFAIYVVQYFAKPAQIKTIAATESDALPQVILSPKEKSLAIQVEDQGFESVAVIQPAKNQTLNKTEKVWSGEIPQSVHSDQVNAETLQLSIKQDEIEKTVPVALITTGALPQVISPTAHTQKELTLFGYSFVLKDIQDVAERYYLGVIGVLIALLFIFAVIKIEALHPKIMTQLYSVIGLAVLVLFL